MTSGNDSVSDVLAPVLGKVVGLLEALGDSKPKTFTDLKSALANNPGLNNVVVYADPLDMLDMTYRLTDDKPVATIKIPDTLHLDVAQTDELLWKTAIARAAQGNATAIFVHPQSDMGQKVADNLKDVLQPSPNSIHPVKYDSKSQVMSLLMKCAEPRHISGAKKGPAFDPKLNAANAERAVKNLVDIGYIEIDGDDETSAVKYNFPSDFTLICIKKLKEKYQKEAPKAMAKVMKLGLDIAPIVLVIRDINIHLKQLKKKIESKGTAAEFVADMQLEEGVNSYLGRKSIRRRSRSRSRSTSRSNSSSSDSDLDVERRPIPTVPVGSGNTSASRPMPVDDFMSSLGFDLSSLTLEDVNPIPEQLEPEVLEAINTLEKMATEKPKKLKGLKNVIKPACRYVYITTLASVQPGTAKEPTANGGDSDNEKPMEGASAQEEHLCQKRKRMGNVKKDSKKEKSTDSTLR